MSTPANPTKGGAAGCIISSRLAAADPTLEILLIEAGPTNLEDPNIFTPGMCGMYMAPDAPKMKFYPGINSEHLGGRSPVVSAAQVLGGGSSVNFLMYTRASASYVTTINIAQPPPPPG